MSFPYLFLEIFKLLMKVSIVTQKRRFIIVFIIILNTELKVNLFILKHCFTVITMTYYLKNGLIIFIGRSVDSNKKKGQKTRIRNQNVNQVS